MEEYERRTKRPVPSAWEQPFTSEPQELTALLATYFASCGWDGEQLPTTSIECDVCCDSGELFELPCCKSAVLCVPCMQRTADAAGMAVRCPFCATTSPAFMEALSKRGIATDLTRESAWAGEDSVVVQVDELICSNPDCLCDFGPAFVSAPQRSTRRTIAPEVWSLRGCVTCGQAGIHFPQCAELDTAPLGQWQCYDCRPAQ